jgi:hypothetical protein
MVAKDGRVKVLDFGLVRSVDPETDAQIAKEGALTGESAPRMMASRRPPDGPDGL